MLISEIKRYIKVNKAVSITDLKLEFDIDSEDLEMPLNLLMEKGYIKAELPTPDMGSSTKCSGCPMGCSSKEKESCSPTPNFIIYTWADCVPEQ